MEPIYRLEITRIQWPLCKNVHFTFLFFFFSCTVKYLYHEFSWIFAMNVSKNTSVRIAIVKTTQTIKNKTQNQRLRPSLHKERRIKTQTVIPRNSTKSCRLVFITFYAAENTNIERGGKQRTTNSILRSNRASSWFREEIDFVGDPYFGNLNNSDACYQLGSLWNWI